MPSINAVIFDAYGTLLDVHAAMARHAARIGPNWATISADWRAKQLEYSWVRSLAGPVHHRDFWRLTKEALAWAAARHQLTDTTLLAEIMLAYRRLDAYPEVPGVLARLGGMGITRAILSNGEPGMLDDAVRAAGIHIGLDAVLSVETSPDSNPALSSHTPVNPLEVRDNSHISSNYPVSPARRSTRAPLLLDTTICVLLVLVCALICRRLV